MSGASTMAALSLQTTLNDIHQESLTHCGWDHATQLTLERANEVIEMICEDYFSTLPKVSIDTYGSVEFSWKIYDRDIQLDVVVSGDDYTIRACNWYTDEIRKTTFSEKERIPKFLKLLDD